MAKNLDTDTILYTFNVSFIGWASDSTGWIKESKDGERYIVMTNHGRKFEASVQTLQERIDEYQSLINVSKNALSLM